MSHKLTIIAENLAAYTLIQFIPQSDTVLLYCAFSFILSLYVCLYYIGTKNDDDNNHTDTSLDNCIKTMSNSYSE